MNTKLMGSITKSNETWQCTDKRLPQTKDLVGPPPTENMLVTLQEIQLQPVGVIKKGKEYIFVWGRRRLKAIRQLFEEGKHNGDVEVVVLSGIEPSDHGRLALIENSQRSPNEINAWETIRAILYGKPVSGITPTYKTVSDYTGLTIGEIKALEKKWGKVPVWAVNAVANGEIAPTTAISVGALSKELQVECKESLKKNKKLSASDVKEKREFVRTQIYSGMMPGLNIPTTRDFFTRDEVARIIILLEQKNFTQALEYANSLMSS